MKSKNSKSALLKLYKFCVKHFSFGFGIGKNKITRKLIKYLESKLKSDFAIVNGNKMYLDKWDSLNLSIDGIYNEYDTKIIQSNVKKGDI